MIILINDSTSRYALTFTLFSYNVLYFYFNKFLASSISPLYIMYLKMPLSFRNLAESVFANFSLFSKTDSLILGCMYTLPLLLVLRLLPSRKWKLGIILLLASDCPSKMFTDSDLVVLFINSFTYSSWDISLKMLVYLPMPRPSKTSSSSVIFLSSLCVFCV